MKNNQIDFFKGKLAIKIETEAQCEKLIQIVEDKGFNIEFADTDDYREYGYVIIDKDGDYSAINIDYIKYVCRNRKLTIMLFNEVF